ncbi:MAG: Lpg1974 family pore-forming outer membrane protein [Nitrospinales bacterium]
MIIHELQVSEGRGVFSDGDEFPYAYQNGSDTLYEIGLDESFAGKVGIGARFGGAWDIGVLYSGLRSTGNTPAFRDGPLGTVATNALFPLVNAYAYPYAGSTTGATFYQGSDATSEQTYHVVDFEVGYTMQLGSADVRLIAGVRYADFLRKDSSTMVWNNVAMTSPYVGVFSRTNDNWGIGPRLGLEFAQPLGSGGVQLTGAVSGSALFGERETIDRALAFLSGIPTPNGVIPHENRYNAGGDDFYNAEGEIGLSYGVELGNARSMIFTVGYRAEAWFGVNNTRSTSSVVPPAGDTESDEFFHGPVLKGTLNF